MQTANHNGANNSVTIAIVDNNIEIMEVNKDQRTSETSITSKETVLQVSEGVPVPTNLNTNNINVSTGTEISRHANEGAPENSLTNNIVSGVSEHCIFKIHKLLRNVNKEAYEPEIIGIGPYHRDEPHLQLMKAHKLRLQDLMLQRRKEDLCTYLVAIKQDEGNARNSYAESTTHIPSDDFVKMLVLDGIFIIELLRKFEKLVSFKDTYGPADLEVHNIRNDPLFKMPWAVNLLQRDLMLFENQLPFFILIKLFKMIEPSGELVELIFLALNFFNDLFPGKGIERNSSYATIEDQWMNTKHLLDLIHMYWGSRDRKVSEKATRSADLELMGSFSNLRGAGVKFEKIENEISFDIEFKGGSLRIPVLNVELRTESLLRNLIVFEQYCGDNRLHVVTDYMTFFNCLIKSDEDIANLTRYGILNSYISDDEVVSNMFKKIILCTIGPSDNFHYAEIFQRVNRHCEKPMNRYKATLRQDHMKNPWRIISIITVTALLFLAILEVVFQILSWQSQISSSPSQFKSSN